MARFDDYPDLIDEACRVFDRIGATNGAMELAKEIRRSGRAYPESVATRVMKSLRRKRYFDAALHLGDAILESGQNADAVRIIYAQALIDTGRIAAALPFLEAFLETSAGGSKGESEARGLLGRAQKQLYVNGGGEDGARESYLLRSFNTYYDAWAENSDRYWHAVNAVAIMDRARRDGVSLRRVAPFAEQLFEEMKRRAAASPDDIWLVATAAEAALAIGKYDAAQEWYERYATSGNADAFEIYSTLRQLIEVWQLTDTKAPGSSLLPLLRGELLKRSGGAVDLKGNEIAHDLQNTRNFEKTFGTDGARSLRWYRKGLERCFSVCRIHNSLKEGFGTGFIVGTDFCGDANGAFLLTNAHVYSDTYPGALRVGDAGATFEAAEDGKDYALKEILWTSNDLDATLARIEPAPPVDAKPFDIAKSLPARDGRQRVYVIGHPGGGTLSVSLNDNLLLDYDDRRVHYRAPTEGGSSGSPVFNSEWKLIALHHAGDFEMPRLNGASGRYEANEGIWVQSILSACRSQH